ncbi:MAG: hypothetical protein H6740_29310, partial [Alphaproteobacteria bacterium]|nr:hypothetical protein [Alphaproteobacteria bacterium]
MAATLFEDAYQDASVRFTVTLDDRGFFRVTFTGQGTVEGTHAFVSM